MSERLAEIRARCDKATAGPWTVRARAPYHECDVIYHECDVRGPERGLFGGQFAKTVDAAFIAHAREDVPYLLAEIDRLRSELEAAKATSTDRTKAGTWVRAGAVWLDMRHVAAVIAPLPGYEGGDVAVYGALTHDPDSANDWRIDFESAGEILAYVQEHQYRPA